MSFGGECQLGTTQRVINRRASMRSQKMGVLKRLVLNSISREPRTSPRLDPEIRINVHVGCPRYRLATLGTIPVSR